jgi:mRNA-degrading endonuclease RelE of RelBE toxin-antitoxin system
VSAQVEGFVKALAPEPRRAVRAGIKALRRDAGDCGDLEGELTGWRRLRVRTYRVIFKESWMKGVRTIDCVYANRRSVVYELFKELLRHQLLQK